MNEFGIVNYIIFSLIKYTLSGKIETVFFCMNNVLEGHMYNNNLKTIAVFASDMQDNYNRGFVIIFRFVQKNLVTMLQYFIGIIPMVREMNI